MRQMRVLALLFCVLAGLPVAAAQEKRVALVVGNSAYQFAPKLGNPSNDAADIAAALGKLGFQVIEGVDLDKAAFDRKVRDFAVALKGADAGVLFYAGHGLQVAGTNYLVPVDAKAEEAAALDLEMVRVDVVHSIMERQTETNVLFLDACRDNPLARNLARSMGTRSGDVGRGLAPVQGGVGTLISFSTQPGNVALDGAGRNSPFAGALVKRLVAPKEDLSAILIDVRNDVMQATKNKQVPWEHSALRGRFYFGAAPGATLPQGSEAAEAWSAVKDSASVGQLEVIATRYKGTVYADLARARIEELKRIDDLKKQQIALATSAKAPEPTLRVRPGSGESFRDCDVCPEMVVVRAGSFMMGSNDFDDEKPPHRVTIKAFAVGKFEVTFAEWEACVAGGGCTSNRSPSDSGWGKGRRPVINVSWNDAKEYVAWLSRKTGQSYRLLSEAEWEYAAGAGTSTPFATGATITTDQANFDGNYTYNGSAKGIYREKTVEVGSFQPNAFGLHDMHGNVWEWVEDTWHPNYLGAPQDGSEWPGGDVSYRVLRGGSWISNPGSLRSADRSRNLPGNRDDLLGFRVARTL